MAERSNIHSNSSSSRDLLLFSVPALLFLTSVIVKQQFSKAQSECCGHCSSPHRKKKEIVEEDDDDNNGEDVFEVFVAPSDRFKFNAAHFIAYKGFRERLHGHNYSVSITLIGRGKIGHDGYLLDFGDVKDLVGGLCKELNERFLLPCQSDAMRVNLSEKVCELICEDGTKFSIPRGDVAELPIVHSSAEELARYLWTRIVDTFTIEALEARHVVAVQVSVAEMPNQQATFRRRLKDYASPLRPSVPPARGCAT